MMIFDRLRRLFVPSPRLDRPAEEPRRFGRRTFFSFAGAGLAVAAAPGAFLSPFQRRMPVLAAEYAGMWVPIGYVINTWKSGEVLKADIKLNHEGWEQFAHGLAENKLRLDLENKLAVLPDVDILDTSKLDLADLGKLVYSRGDGKLSLAIPGTVNG